MEPKKVTTTNGNLGIPLATSVKGVKVPPPSKTLSSVSSSYSSPDSILGDPFGEDDYEPPHQYTSKSNSLAKLDQHDKSGSSDSEKPVAGSSVPSIEASNHELPLSVSQSEVSHHHSVLKSNNSSTTEPHMNKNYEHGGYTPNKDSLQKLNKDKGSGFADYEKPVSGTSRLSSEGSNHVPPSKSQSGAAQNPDGSSSIKMSTTESPPTQVMERSTNKSYRIPSAVFARDKSTKPGEWSVASNESLFSIHMGTMSFTKDHVRWPSGELGTPPGLSTSTNMSNFPAKESADSKPTDGKSPEMGKSDAEVLRENEHLNHEISLAESTFSRISQESGNSTTSFAFPILAGDMEKETSARIVGSIKLTQEQQQPQLEPIPEPHMEPVPQSEPKTPAATENANQKKWLSCFSCCPIGS